MSKRPSPYDVSSTPKRPALSTESRGGTESRRGISRPPPHPGSGTGLNRVPLALPSFSPVPPFGVQRPSVQRAVAQRPLPSPVDPPMLELEKSLEEMQVDEDKGGGGGGGSKKWFFIF